MRILITGGRGQLGRELQQTLCAETVLALGRQELDVSDAAAVGRAVGQFRPQVVVHAAAYTDTAGCEADPELAMRVNGEGTRQVALACRESDAAMLYVSTNEVFDGRKGETYLESDEPKPINAYGRSKLAGERYVRSILDRSYIVRTAWLYAAGGNNFPSKVLQLGPRCAVGARVWAPTAAALDDLTRRVEKGQAGRYLLRRPAWQSLSMAESGSR